MNAGDMATERVAKCKLCGKQIFLDCDCHYIDNSHGKHDCYCAPCAVVKFGNDPLPGVFTGATKGVK